MCSGSFLNFGIRRHRRYFCPIWSLISVFDTTLMVVIVSRSHRLIEGIFSLILDPIQKSLVFMYLIVAGWLVFADIFPPFHMLLFLVKQKFMIRTVVESNIWFSNVLLYVLFGSLNVSDSSYVED